jgi:ABC-2 type transport system ATP-binding protein
VDDVVIIARGRLVHASSLTELEALAAPSVRVTSPDVAGLHRLISAAGWADQVEPAAVGQEGVAVIHHVTAPEIGARAFAAGLELHELVPRDVGLEDIFLRLVGEDAGAQVAEPHLEGGVAR